MWTDLMVKCGDKVKMAWHDHTGQMILPRAEKRREHRPLCCKPRLSPTIAKGRAFALISRERSRFSPVPPALIFSRVSVHYPVAWACLWVAQPWMVPFSYSPVSFQDSSFNCGDRWSLFESPPPNFLHVVPSRDLANSVWFLSPGNSAAERVSASVGHISVVRCGWDSRKQFCAGTWGMSRQEREEFTRVENEGWGHEAGPLYFSNVTST